jgi:hypothetical protein
MNTPLQLRRFNALGLSEIDRIIGLDAGDAGSTLTALLSRDDLTEVITPEANVVPRNFNNRWECAKFFHELIESNRASIRRDPETDRGLWTWLAFAWYQYLKKPNSVNGTSWPRERWILSMSYSRYYKHLLAGPWIVYRKYSENPEFCKVLLLPEITTPGHDISEHFLCKYELVNSPGFVAVAAELYMRADGQGYKRGVQGNRKGTIRRLRLYSGQLELTYDLMSLTRERILELLPLEFSRFR